MGKVISIPTPPHQGLRAVQRGLTERVEALEQQAAITSQVLPGLQETMSAVVALLGPEAIQKQIDTTRRERATANAEAAKAELKRALEAGEVVATEKVTGASIVVGRDVDPRGETIHPGYAQLHYRQIAPEFQDLIVGEGIGFEFETRNGCKFVVDAIFEPVPPEKRVPPPPPNGAGGKEAAAGTSHHLTTDAANSEAPTTPPEPPVAEDPN